MPALFALTTGVTFPSLYVFNALVKQFPQLSANRGLPLAFVAMAVNVWLGGAAGAAHWALWCVACTFVSVSQPAVGAAFAAHQAGRALSAFNLVIFSGVFVLQWGIGLAIDGQVPGTACYDPRRHGLVPTGPAPAWADCQAVLGFECEDPPAAVLVLTARPQATLAKYGERGARFALLEAGSHLGALQAGTARAGLGGVAIGAFQDRALLALIGADPRQTLALLAYAVGHADD